MSIERDDGLAKDLRRFSEAWTVLYSVFVPSIGKIILNRMNNQRCVLVYEDWGATREKHKQYFDADDPAVSAIEEYMRGISPNTQQEFDAAKQQIERIIRISDQQRF